VRVVAVDPGLHGALALIKEDGSVKIYDTPIRLWESKSRANKETYDYDIRACRKLLKKLVNGKKTKICLEGVHPFLGSKVSNFLLGRSKGIWEATIVSLGLDYSLVPMRSWITYFFGKEKRKDKKKSNLKMASKLFPEAKKYFKLKKHDGRADSVLIAEFVRRNSK
jgi:hypothetical protein